jgi:hypothetical protein
VLVKLREKIKPLWVDKTARRLLIASTIFNLVAWILLIIRLFPSIRRGLIIALHYNIYLNVNEVGVAWLALLPAAIGTLIAGVNVALAARAYVASRSNALVLLAITAFYEMLLTAAAVFIILINMPH